METSIRKTMEAAGLVEYLVNFDHTIWIDKDSGVKVFLVNTYCNNKRRKIPDWVGSLSATTVEMLDHGFFKSYDQLYEVLFDRPSEAPNISYGEGSSSSHSEPPPPPQVFNDGSINPPPGPGEYVSIDIPTVVINQQWKDYVKGEIDRKKRDDSTISESTLAIAGQAVGALMSSTVSGSSSKTANFVAAATVLGVGFTLSGIGLRRVKPMLYGVMTKLGAVATASAIILTLGSTVVPAVAWTAGAVACLLIFVGVAVA